MGFFIVHGEPKTVTYRANLCSLATFVVLIISILTVIPPLMIVLFAGDFLRIDRRNEKPDVKFKNKTLFRLNSDVYGNYVTWSTFQNHINFDSSRIRPPSILKAGESDVDSDGSLDQLDLQINFPLHEKEEINKVDIILFFQYQLKEIINFEMESMVHVSHSFSIGGNQLQIIGHLELVQNIPICSYYANYKSPVIDGNSSKPSTFHVFNISKSYNNRMIRTSIRSFPILTYNQTSMSNFSIHLNIKYPHHFNIIYKLPFWEALKWFFIIYLALLLFFYWAFDEMKSLIFKYNLVYTVVKKTIKLNCSHFIL